MRSKSNALIILLLVFCVFLAGCSKAKSIDEPVGSANYVDAKPVQKSTEKAALSADEGFPGANAVKHGRTYSSNIVNSYIGKIQGALLRDGITIPYLGVFLESYVYYKNQKKAYLEFKLVNSSKLFLTSLNHAFSATIYTLEGQKCSTKNSGYSKAVLPPQSHCYFYYSFENVNDPLDFVTVKQNSTETNISLRESALLPRDEFLLPKNIDCNLNITDNFKLLSNFSEPDNEDYQNYNNIREAKITSITFNDNGGELQVTITPDKYIPTSIIKNDGIFYLLRTNAGQIIQLDLSTVEGNEIDSQYPSNEPIIIKFALETRLLEKCNEMQLMTISKYNGENSNYDGITSSSISLNNEIIDDEVTSPEAAFN